jgi:hypothetical protein
LWYFKTFVRKGNISSTHLYVKRLSMLLLDDIKLFTDNNISNIYKQILPKQTRNYLFKDSFADSLNIMNVWTSATKWKDAQEFIWTNSGKPLSYTKWVPGQPYILLTGEVCVKMYREKEYQWGDDACTPNTVTAVCEW